MAARSECESCNGQDLDEGEAALTLDHPPRGLGEHESLNRYQRRSLATDRKSADRDLQKEGGPGGPPSVGTRPSPGRHADWLTWVSRQLPAGRAAAPSLPAGTAGVLRTPGALVDRERVAGRRQSSSQSSCSRCRSRACKRMRR